MSSTLHDSDDDDTPQLSAHTLQALQEFYAEHAARDQEDATANEMPTEDWQLSQFWYSEETAEILAKEVLEQVGGNGSIACLSCPTLYHKLRDIKPEGVKLHILEYDSRFEKFGEDFVFYDYNKPLEIHKSMNNYYDIVVADPPFLSEECLTKTAITVKFMAKDKILLCTGAIMKDLAERLLKVKECKYIPKHTKNLANEFCCYSNFEPIFLNKCNEER